MDLKQIGTELKISFDQFKFEDFSEEERKEISDDMRMRRTRDLIQNMQIKKSQMSYKEFQSFKDSLNSQELGFSLSDLTAKQESYDSTKICTTPCEDDIPAELEDFSKINQVRHFHAD